MAEDKRVKVARERFKLAEEADEKQRTRELASLRFYAGEQWDADLLKSRSGQTIGSGTTQQIIPARPSLTINKTREPVRQVLNQERQSDLSIQLIPADDFGESAGPIDHTEIELREGLVRRIQRDSEAADARTWGFARASIAGRGYYGVMTRFVPGKSWDQEIYLQRFYNQSAVLLDPMHEQPDGSDAEWGFVGVDMGWDQYKAEFPSTAKKHNRVTTATDDEWRTLGDEAPGWFKTEGDTRSVRVVDYYYTERETRELLLLQDGSVAWFDEAPAGVPVADTRRVVTKSIKWCKIDGISVLDETDWPGHYIPIIKIVGEELQPYDQERRCEGIVAPMIQACQGYNYIVSKFVERVGLTPIAPILMAGGQDEGYAEEWNAANTRTLGRLHYNQKDDFNTPAPPPFRPDARAEIADIAMGVQMFGQAISSTSVVPETALGNVDPSVKSGKLAKALIDQAERGTSNFLDNLVRSMRHEARIINDLLYPIYGRPGRLARMMNTQGEMSAVLIGQPFTVEGQGKQAKPQPIQVQSGQPLPPGAKEYKLTPDAEFNVAVKIAKNEGTRREQEVQTLGEMISADPQLMAVLGDLFFKYQDGPGHEEMSERMKAILLPQVQAQLNGGKAPSNPEDQQKMQMMAQQLQELQQLADKNKTDLQKAEIGKQEAVEKAHIDADVRIKVAGIQAEATVTSAEIKAFMDDSQTRIAHMEALIGISSEHALQDKEHDHEREMATLQHAQALQQGDQQQQNALEQGAQGHQNALEQQAAQPQSEAGA